MNKYLIALGLASLPAVSDLIGGLLAEGLPYSKRSLGIALHAAAGVLLAVVAVELMPRLTEAKSPWITMLTLIAGGGFFTLISKLLDYVQKRAQNASRTQTPWIVLLSAAIHLFNDSLMIGISVTIAQSLGIMLASARVIAHIPEGFATIAEFKRQQTARRIRLPLLLIFVLSTLIGASLGYWALRGQANITKLAVLAFTTGTLITAVVEEIIPEAHETQDTVFSHITFVTSFALFALFLTYFES